MDQTELRKEEIYAKAIADFPFELVRVRGEEALAAWKLLKMEDRGAPIVIGDDQSIVNLMTPFDPSNPVPARSVTEILDAATRIKIPDDLFARRKAETAASEESIAKLLSGPDASLPTIIETRDNEEHVTSYLEHWGGMAQIQVPRGKNSRVLSPEETRAILSQRSSEPQEGEWPSESPQSTGLTVATDILSGKYLETVNIAIIPTDDWTTVPAHLRWGDWNDCPPPEIHVAALRSWRARYGLELIGMSFDTMNLRATTHPSTRQEALALSRELYAYCTDIIDQGAQTYSALAATLMSDDWWFFWWD